MFSYAVCRRLSQQGDFEGRCSDLETSLLMKDSELTSVNAQVARLEAQLAELRQQATHAAEELEAAREWEVRCSEVQDQVQKKQAELEAAITEARAAADKVQELEAQLLQVCKGTVFSSVGTCMIFALHQGARLQGINSGRRVRDCWAISYKFAMHTFIMWSWLHW